MKKIDAMRVFYVAAGILNVYNKDFAKEFIKFIDDLIKEGFEEENEN